MSIEIAKLKDVYYGSEIEEKDDKAIYCEIKYKRDRSSFAGMAFKLNEDNAITVRKCEEKIIQAISTHENMYMGCDFDYINSIHEIFSAEERTYGLEILFLVYSDVRSSQIIFEELMKCVDESMDRITQLF